MRSIRKGNPNRMSPASNGRPVSNGRRAPAPGKRLTERECQVAVLVADGLKNAEIGQRMFLSEDTVKTHLRRAMAKLGARSRVDVAAWCFRTGKAGTGAPAGTRPPGPARAETVKRMFAHLHVLADGHRSVHQAFTKGCERCQAISTLRQYILDPW